ncbi:RNA dependent RNA polymerase-domain-containing protein [Ephemerocybe angulata]|uniref:RNA-dependent RNA polymerase n=1 Tax=Ephemerocybe angulata TaxID=980116 RepID=A0A8H6MFW9_9AGAR|nr:RNA dependent RNA polymerase-domain-containing protein [Tulosesus angulatus]
MNIEISYIHREENEWSVTRAIAAIIHAGLEEKINFKVRLNPDAKGGYGHNGTGTLTVPDYKVGRDFITQVIENPIKTKWSRKLFFKKVPQPPPKHLIQTLARTNFVDPDQEERHAKIMLETGDTVRLEKVQFGTLQYHPPYPGRSFSIEWGRSYAPVGFAELSFEYNHKLIRITIREDFETHRDPEEYMIVLKFSNIKKIGVGLTFGESFVLFDTYTPPILEKKHVYRTLKGDHTDNKKYKQRVGSLDPAHHAVAPYATKLRLILWREPSQVAEEERARFFRLCNSAKLKSLVKIFRDTTEIPAEPMGFFKASRLEKLQHALAQLAFPVAFQIEALMRNGLLHTEHIEHLLPRIQELSNNSTPPVVSELLRTYRKDLEKAGDKLGAEEHPVEQTFKKTLSAFEAKDDEAFRCGHVTFTPTRKVLEGPYPTDSNRIIRKYKEHRDHFLRVDFRDEELMQYRWEREVDGASFLKERVGGILKDGFQLAGRSFEFLAYSNSALKSHAVWFINPFQFTLSPNQKIWVNGEYIRQNIGNFAGSDLLRHPSKYAARLAQAFTATDSSVRLHRNNWEEVPDLGTKPYLFTDGVGTISEEKRDEIWDAMKKKRGGLVPSAFMIRFLGYKGVVVVDRELDVLNSARTAGEHPIHMRLRPSMRKFAAVSDGEADIEIADAYNTPKPCNLNRALVMLLERLGVEKDAFIKLQDNEVAKAKTIDENLVKFKAVIDQHGLGKSYRLTSILEQLRELGFEINSNSGLPSADTPFLRLLRSFAVIKVLRDIMFSARIPIPGSYLLVGVADEGVVYEKAGYENVYTLPEFNIYACIQREGGEKDWIEGTCFITRSPVAHPGDVQRVYAIGEPPADCFCAFRDLVNVVVMPSAGDRSLASCLGGGDLDGDEFAVITDPSLLPNEHFDAANYEPPNFEPWERDCEVEDICDFFVEYINSDVLGLLSDRLLVIADQSKVNRACCLKSSIY